MCSLVLITCKFDHLHTIDSGALQQIVLSSMDKVSESVVTQSSFELEYVGDPLVEGEYLITLKGVPPNLLMNPAQKRYFEKVTTQFFSEFSEVPVCYVQLTDEVLGGEIDGVDGEEEIVDEDTERRRRQKVLTSIDLGTVDAFGRQNHKRYLRGSNNIRQLEEGESYLVTTFYGSGNAADLRASILETASINEERYLKELALQQLRPGEINKNDSGSHFANLVGAVVGMVPPGFNAPEPTVAEIAAEEEVQLYMMICYLVFAFSTLWLVYRIIRDCCYSPDEETKGMKGILGGLLRQFPATDFDRSSVHSHPPNIPQRRPSLEKSLRDQMKQEQYSERSLDQDQDNTAASEKPLRKLSEIGTNFRLKPQPRNQAGQNGRGLQPSRSLPTFLSDTDNGDENEEMKPRKRSPSTKTKKPSNTHNLMSVPPGTTKKEETGSSAVGKNGTRKPPQKSKSFSVLGGLKQKRNSFSELSELKQKRDALSKKLKTKKTATKKGSEDSDDDSETGTSAVGKNGTRKPPQKSKSFSELDGLKQKRNSFSELSELKKKRGELKQKREALSKKLKTKKTATKKKSEDSNDDSETDSDSLISDHRGKKGRTSVSTKSRPNFKNQSGTNGQRVRPSKSLPMMIKKGSEDSDYESSSGESSLESDSETESDSVAPDKSKTRGRGSVASKIRVARCASESSDESDIEESPKVFSRPKPPRKYVKKKKKYSPKKPQRRLSDNSPKKPQRSQSDDEIVSRSILRTISRRRSSSRIDMTGGVQ